VHYAVKWSPGRSESARISYYYNPPAISLEEVSGCLEHVYTACPASRAYAITLELLSLPEICSLEGDMMLMLVTEEGTDRLSFDVNLYDAEIDLDSISTRLDAVADYFEVDKRAWRELLSGNSMRQLGHLAGGLNGKGSEFFTFYFGVEERKPW
jgi:hypothetical protein